MKKDSKKPANRKTLFQKISLLFFDRPRLAAIIFLAIFSFGIASYTTLLKREGFPAIVIPYSFITGPYIVGDSERVDKEVAKPISDYILQRKDVKQVDTQSGDNFFNVIIQYKEDVNAETASADIEKQVRSSNLLPAAASSAEFKPLSPGVTQRGDDTLISVYSVNNNLSAQELQDQATKASEFLAAKDRIPLQQWVKPFDPFVRGTDPVTGEQVVSQTAFDTFGVREKDENIFRRAVTVGIKGTKGFDALELDKQVLAAVDELNNSGTLKPGVKAVRVYSIAPQVNAQISNLQTSLLEGLIAVLVVSAVLIALRASMITVASMLMVIAATLGVLYLIGYTLNVITLFSLVLCLSLIVDDTIIMVEAIDARRRKGGKARDVISEATRKISRAMIAATMTATVGFAPLLFVGGILGSFIRAIPITVITSLLISLVIALTFMPVLARYVLLKKDNAEEKGSEDSPAHHIEAIVAKTLSRPLVWTKHHRKRQVSLGIVAAVVGLSFIIGGAVLFQKVSFNIFAPAKDSDGVLVTMTFAPTDNVQQTQAVASKAQDIIGDTLGENFARASYYGSADLRQGVLYVDVKPYKQREIKAPQMVKDLENRFKGFEGAVVKVGTLDNGPPAGAFTVLVNSEQNKEGAYQAANAIATYLNTTSLKRPNGTEAAFKGVTVGNPDLVSRKDGKAFVTVSAEFNGTDTSTLVLLAKAAVEKEFGSTKLKEFNLQSADITFNFGQEEENQDSFKAMLIAFPILLGVLYLLLILQFRSFLQPALIFMAIPFSFLGITAGLWATDNAFSFFTMLGFFALIGLSIKNTILLTDYANQAHRLGAHPVDAIATALQERFRPLFATSVTAIVSLIPLYRSDPFWEGLAVTLMFGLLSSTFLVITVFPYYYLAAEYLRMHISQKKFGLWLLSTILLAAVTIKSVGPGAAWFGPVMTTIVFSTIAQYSRRQRKMSVSSAVVEAAPTQQVEAMAEQPAKVAANPSKSKSKAKAKTKAKAKPAAKKKKTAATKPRAKKSKAKTVKKK